MGKASYSPLGQWRKKVGGQVYRIDGGEQIITAYQPVVKNPRTEGQMSTRSRFALATKYVACIAPWLRDINRGLISGGRRIRAFGVSRVMEGTSESGGIATLVLSSLTNRLVPRLAWSGWTLTATISSTTAGVATYAILATPPEDFDPDLVSIVQADIAFVAASGNGNTNNPAGRTLVELTYNGEQGGYTGNYSTPAVSGADVLISNIGLQVILSEAGWIRFANNLDASEAGRVNLNAVYSESNATIVVGTRSVGAVVS